MATYKVIQDIEAEDKLLGPLTLRQFIYAAMVVTMGFIAFKLATSVHPLFVIPFLGPMFFFGLLAAPFGSAQSSEVWLLAKIRFFLKPRKRIWDQTGMRELVTITAPKKIERVLTDGLSQEEVKSRLQALANTIDSRGWAVKNVNVNLTDPSYAAAYATGGSDRLVAPSSLPQDVPTYDIYAADDILDPANNPKAQALEAMISQSAQVHRQAAVAAAQGKAPVQPSAGQPANYWFMNQPDPSTIPVGQAAFGNNPTYMPGMASQISISDKGDAEQALLDRIHKEKSKKQDVYGHTKVLRPLGDQRSVVDDSLQKHKKPAKKHDYPAEAPATKPVDPKLLQLAGNDDLNIATIAREADKATKPPTAGADGEVVISLR